MKKHASRNGTCKATSDLAAELGTTTAHGRGDCNDWAAGADLPNDLGGDNSVIEV